MGTYLGAPGRGSTHLPGLVHTPQELRQPGQDVAGCLQSGPHSGVVPGQLLPPSLASVGKAQGDTNGGMMGR